MRICSLCFCLLYFLPVRAQQYSELDSIGQSSLSENIYVRKIAGDSLSSSFCILIKKEVKAHKHLLHSENVIVLQGQGLMHLGEKQFVVQKGDLVFIPKNTVHAVQSTGTVPLKVLSIQSPAFDGSDRVMMDKDK